MEGIVSARGDYRGRNGSALLVIVITCAAAAVVSVAVVRPSLSYPIILGAFGVAGFLLAIKRFYLCLVAFVIFLFFEGMIKNAYPYALTFFLRDVFLAAIYLVWFVKYPIRRGFRGRYDKPISIAIGIFVFYTLVITIIPFTDEPLLHRVGGARWWLANIPLFFVGADVINSRAKFDRLCYVFLGVAAATGLYGVIQYWVGFDHLYKISDHYEYIATWGQWHGVTAEQALRRRVFSTFNMPGGLAAAMHAAILVGVAYTASVQKFKYRMALIGLLVLFFAALAFTGCRSTYVPVVFSIAIYAVWCQQRRQLATVVLALIAGLVVVSLMSRGVYLYRLTLVVTDYQYTLARISWDWLRAVDLVQGHPLGLGITTSAKVGRIFVGEGWTSGFRLIENGYGAALVSLGWPGLFLFVTMLLVVSSRLLGLARFNLAGNWRTLIVFAYCVSMLLPMLTGMPLYTGLGPVFYWLLAGAATSIYVRKG